MIVGQDVRICSINELTREAASLNLHCTLRDLSLSVQIETSQIETSHWDCARAVKLNWLTD